MKMVAQTLARKDLAIFFDATEASDETLDFAARMAAAGSARLLDCWTSSSRETLWLANAMRARGGGRLPPCSGPPRFASSGGLRNIAAHCSTRPLNMMPSPRSGSSLTAWKPGAACCPPLFFRTWRSRVQFGRIVQRLVRREVHVVQRRPAPCRSAGMAGRSCCTAARHGTLRLRMQPRAHAGADAVNAVKQANGFGMQQRCEISAQLIELID